MNQLEQDSLRFVALLSRMYFAERDLDGVLARMTDDVEWIGTGRQDGCRGIREARKMLEMERRVFHGSFSLEEDGYEAAALTEELCLVTGEICLREKDMPAGQPDLLLRVSCICRREADGLKLRQLHLSTPSSEQLEGEFFPHTVSEEGTGRLRRMLNERTAELEEMNRDLNALTNNIPGGVICCEYGETLKLIQYSEGFLSMFGYTAEELQTRFHNNFAGMIYEKDLRGVWETALRQLAKSNTKEIEYRVRCKDGRLVWVLDRGQLVEDERGRKWFYCILIDITRTKKAQEELRLSLERHQIIMDQTTDIIFEWDISRDYLSCSSNYHKKFGYHALKENASVAIAGGSHLHPDDTERFCLLVRNVREGTPYSETEFRIADAAGNYIWCRIRATLQVDENGRPAKAVGVIIDIDREKRRTQKLQEKAERDALTGLYNKGTTQTLVEKYLAEDAGETSSALMIIDVDNFKLVNDLYGHLSGDAMLSDAASALKKMFRSGDVVGRVGGDEFCVLMRGIRDAGIVSRKAEDILKVFSDLSRKEAAGENLSCSVGIALYPQDGADFNTLFCNADRALYRAKERGKNGYAFHSEASVRGRRDSVRLMPRTSVGAPIDSDRNAGVMDDRLAEYVFHVLYRAADVEAAIPLILEIVGRQFDVCRAYLFEISEDGCSFRNTFEWCREEAREKFGETAGETFACGDFSRQLDMLRETGVFYCRDTSLLPGSVRELMERRGVRSALQCAIHDGAELHGGLGFDECRSNRLWTQKQVDTLTFVSEIVSAFLLKKRAQIRANRLVGSLEAVLNHRDSWVFVVDRDSFEILYANARARALLPGLRVGERCHMALFGSPEPCTGCPVLLEGSPAGAEVYSPLLRKRFSARMEEVAWSGERRAFLLTCCETEPVTT